MAGAGEIMAKITLGGMKQVEKQLKNFSDSMKDTSKKLKSMGDELKSAGDGIKSFGEDLLPISAGLGALATAGVVASSEINGAIANFQNKLGASGDDLVEYEKVMETVGSTGVGSFDDVSQAIVDITQNMRGLKSDELETLTVQAMHLAEVMGAEVQEVSRSAGTLMHQFGIEGQTSLDLIAKGYQNNLDFSGEFLDSLDEYSVHFNSLGFSAEDMFNILINGAESGAWNLDKVGDAIKEGNIRMKDMSSGSTDAFESLGLNAEKMFNDFSAGGDTANGAFMTVMASLSQMTDDTKRNEVGVALFGTMYEDLEADVINSFSNIENSLGDYSGTAEQVAKDNQTFGQTMAGAWNDIQVAIKPVGDAVTEIVTTVLPPLLSIIKTVGGAFASLPKPIQTMIVALGGIIAVIPIILVALGSFITLIGTTLTSLGTIAGVFGKVGTAGTILTKAFKMIGSAFKILRLLFVANPFMLIATGIAIVVGLVIKYWDEISEVTIAVFSAIAEWFAPYWDAFKEMIAKVVDGIVVLWEGFKEAFLDVMGVVIETALSLWDSFASGFMVVFDAVVSFLEGAWEVIKTIFLVAIGIVLTLIQPIYNAFADVFNKVVDFINVAWGWIKESFVQYVEMTKENLNKIKEFFQTAWTFIYESIIKPVFDLIMQVFNFFKEHVTAILNTVKEVFTKAWNFILDNIITPVIETIKKVIQTVVDKVTQVATGIKNAFTTAWNYVYSNIIAPVINKIKSIIETIKTTVSNVGNNIKDSLSKAFNTAKDKVTGAIDKILKKVGKMWTKVKEIAGKIKDAVSGLFSAIKVPSFDLGGWSVGDLPKLPKFNVQWNAKGGILDNSTLIGAGEKGAEAIVPLSSQRRMRPFAEAVANYMPEGASGGGVNVEVAQLIVREEADIRKVSQELYKQIERERKGGGRR